MSDIDPAQIQQLMNSLNLTSAQAEDVARSLNRLSQSTRGQATAADAQKEAADRVTRSYDSLKSAGSNTAQGLGTMLTGINSMTAGVNSTREVFMALIPPINLATEGLQKMIMASGGVLGSLLTKFPIVGAMTEGVQKVLVQTVGFLSDTLKNQIQETQKLVNEYKTLADAGMVFGGSLGKAAMAARNAGVDLLTFSLFASKHAQSLAMMGGNAQQAAGDIMKMSKDISPGLLAMYGNMENLAGEVADYVAMQSRLGIDAVANQKSLKEGAKEYLLNQKELSNITGKRTEELKKEEEDRRRVAAYQLRLSEMTKNEQANISVALTRARELYGEDAHKYLMDIVVSNGEVVSQTGQKFQALAPALADTLNSMYQNINTSQDGFKQVQAKIIQDSAPMIKAELEANRDLLILAAQGYLGDVGVLLNSVASKALETQTQQLNAVTAQVTATQSTVDAMNKLPDAIDKVYTRMMEFNLKMQDITLEGIYPKKGEKSMIESSLDLLEAFQKPYLDALRDVRDLTKILLDGNKGTSDVLLKLVEIAGLLPKPVGPEDPTPSDHWFERLGDWISSTTSQVNMANPVWTDQNPLPVRVAVAPPNPVASSTTNDILGETTAMVPVLKEDNKVQMKEPDPILLALQDQNKILADVARYSKDNYDTSGRILNALS